MRKKILLLFFICFCTVVSAQNTFEKVIDTLGSSTALCIQETFDGGYVYCGMSSNNGNDVIIVKLDSIGKTEWAKTYSGTGIEYATYIEQTPDSGYMVNAVYNSGLTGLNWLLRLDTNGDTLWTKTFSVGGGATETGNGNSMASVNNFLYGMTGYYKSPSLAVSAYFIASNGNGFQLASKTYNPSSTLGTESRSIDKTYDDGFIMAGVISTSISTTDIYFIRTNTYGDTLWTRAYDSSQTDVAFDVKQTTDSGFIAACIIYDTTVYKYNIYLIKTDSTGDTLWTKQYFSPFEQVAYSIQQANDGGYILTGYANTAVGRSLYLIKTNATGDTLWTRMFNANIDNWGFFVRQTKDDGFIISGISYGSYIIKTDSMGMVGSGTGIAEVNNPISFTVYPNPTTGIFTIEAKGISRLNSTIKIYNVTSECIYTCQLKNNETKQINLSALPNGMYVVLLNTKDKVYSKKIIISK